MIKPLTIGKIKLGGNVLLAPLAGYTDYAFRGICLSLGASLAFTEMVSCMGLYYNNEHTADLLYCSSEKVRAAQIFGSNPEVMRAACESKYLKDFDIIDINAGCPVPKLFNNGEGAALLKDPKLFARIVSECVKSGKTVTVKIRTGVTSDRPVTEEFAKIAEGEGAAMLTVHGRPREAYYAGEVNYGEIAKAKRSVGIPVIANGGIFTKEDADIMFERTGADGIMIARGALYNPFIFSEICGKTCDKGYFWLLSTQIDLLKERFADDYIARNLRKQAACYLRGARGGKAAKAALCSCKTTDELKRVAQSVFGK